MKEKSVTTSESPHLYSRRAACRGCGGARLSPFLSLGDLPLANAFLTADQLREPESRFPLEVYFCRDCALVQLLHVVSPQVLFSNYIYRTGTNETIARHNAALAQQAAQKGPLRPGDFVLEIASNDGSLLQCFRQRGMRTLGVEPAENIAAIACQSGIDTLNAFFDERSAAEIVGRYGPARVVLANNVLAHVDPTVDFLRACKQVLADDGWVIVEVPYLAEMLSRLEYDTIYHEHLCYFSVTALMKIFARAGLELEHIDQVEIHGGSLRLWARHASPSGHAHSVCRMADQESEAGLTRPETYWEFALRVERNRDQLRQLLQALRDDGKSVVGYGAPAKGNTLLCYCGIGPELLSFTVDRSPLKVGLFTPGMHIPVEPVERIFAAQPDYVLLLAWNFAPEIMEFLNPYKQRGGKFILPIPEPTLV
jgi:hypothetical protein